MNCIENFSSSNELDQDATFVNRDVLSIPKIHCAYTDSKKLLDFLKQAFVLDKDLASKMIRMISEMKSGDKRLGCLELVLLEEIIVSCSHKKERTAGEELAQIYVSEIKQWQPIVERGLSFIPIDEFCQELKLRIRYL